MMKREDQISFMEGCQERVRGYVASWLRDPLFREALHRGPVSPDPAPADHDSTDEPARKYG